LRDHSTNGKVEGTVVSSAVRITDKSFKNRFMTTEAWQKEAMDLRDRVGEFRFVTNAIGNAISKARLFAAKEHPSGEPEEAHPDSFPAQVVSMFGHGIAGRSELLQRLATLRAIIGVGYLIGTVIDRNRPLMLSNVEWNIYSPEEVQFTPGRLRIKDDDAEWSAYSLKEGFEQAYVIRSWKPHPNDRWEPDSAGLASLPVLKVIAGLTRRTQRDLDSRLVGNGIYVIPEGSMVPHTREDDLGLMGELIEVAETALSDDASAAATLPVLLQIPDGATPPEHQTFWSEFDESTGSLLDRYIARLALSMDVAPEVLTGFGDSNRWNAWASQDTTISTFFEPEAEDICGDLTQELLRPLLEGTSYNPKEWLVWYDLSALKQRPNRAAEAEALYSVGGIKLSTYVEELGFDEYDMPSQSAESLALAAITKEPVLIQEPGVNALVAAYEQLLDQIAIDEASRVVVEEGTDIIPTTVERIPDTIDEQMPEPV
jgi:hypothetical protein